MFKALHREMQPQNAEPEETGMETQNRKYPVLRAVAARNKKAPVTGARSNTAGHSYMIHRSDHKRRSHHAQPRDIP